MEICNIGIEIQNISLKIHNISENYTVDTIPCLLFLRYIRYHTMSPAAQFTKITLTEIILYLFHLQQFTPLQICVLKSSIHATYQK